jgi:hypothetical protein
VPRLHQLLAPGASISDGVACGFGDLGACSVGGGPSEEQHRGMACAVAEEGERDDSGGDENFGRSLAKPG